MQPPPRGGCISIPDTNVHFYKELPHDPHTQPQPPPARGQPYYKWQGEGCVLLWPSRPSWRSLRGSSVHCRGTVVDGSSHQPGLTPWRTPPRMRPSCHPISRGLAAFHATRSASTARSGWLPRSTTTHTSPCSAAWNRGAGGGQVLGCSNQMTLELNHMPHALVCARHHSDSMRWRSHVESADTRQPSTMYIARPDLG